MEILISLVILIFSVILHEVMHGIVANKLGDPTAKLAGRLTLNPIPHIDPMMTIIVPALMYYLSAGTFFFAAAKPVPINPIHFKDPLKDMAITALAGPFTNFALAGFFAVCLNILPLTGFVGSFFAIAVYINLLLGVFNLIPIPPLDGSRLISAVLPHNLALSYLSIERYGIFILLALLYLPIGGFSLGDWVSNVVSYLFRLLVQ